MFNWFLKLSQTGAPINPQELQKRSIASELLGEIFFAKNGLSAPYQKKVLGKWNKDSNCLELQFLHSLFWGLVSDKSGKGVKACLRLLF